MKLKQKWKSRKFWAGITGLAAGIGIAFGLDEGVISTVSGAVVSLFSVVAYMMAEGRVDAAAVQAQNQGGVKI